MSVRTFKGEGSEFSQIVGLLRKVSSDTQAGAIFRLGTVESGLPGLRIRVDETRRLLEPDDVVITESLYGRELAPGDRVIMFAYQTEYGPEYVVIDRAVRLT